GAGGTHAVAGAGRSGGGGLDRGGLDPGRLNVRLEVLRAQDHRPPPVGAVGDRPCELELGVVCGDRDDLARLDVRAQSHGEVCQAGNERIPAHARGVYAAAWRLTARYQPTVAVGADGASASASSRASP